MNVFYMMLNEELGTDSYAKTQTSLEICNVKHTLSCNQKVILPKLPENLLNPAYNLSKSSSKWI